MGVIGFACVLATSAMAFFFIKDPDCRFRKSERKSILRGDARFEEKMM
jgi:hypothetical protein